jgi:hypothetical protein
VIALECEITPFTPVSVAVYVLLAEELQVRVDDPPPGLTLVGLSVQARPAGVDIVRLTEPVKPLMTDTEICEVAACPAKKLTVLGDAESAKSAGRNNEPPTCLASIVTS